MTIEENKGSARRLERTRKATRQYESVWPIGHPSTLRLRSGRRSARVTAVGTQRPRCGPKATMWPKKTTNSLLMKVKKAANEPISPDGAAGGFCGWQTSSSAAFRDWKSA